MGVLVADGSRRMGSLCFARPVTASVTTAMAGAGANLLLFNGPGHSDGKPRQPVIKISSNTS